MPSEGGLITYTSICLHYEHVEGAIIYVYLHLYIRIYGEYFLYHGSSQRHKDILWFMLCSIVYIYTTSYTDVILIYHRGGEKFHSSSRIALLIFSMYSHKFILWQTIMWRVLHLERRVDRLALG